MIELHLPKFLTCGLIQLFQCVCINIIINNYLGYIVLFVSVGIGYTAEYIKQVQSQPLLSLEAFEVPLKFKFNVNHSKEKFTKPVNRFIKQYANAFDFYILNINEVSWETFECPMIFSHCQYNWCVSGENPMVG